MQHLAIEAVQKGSKKDISVSHRCLVRLQRLKVSAQMCLNALPPDSARAVCLSHRVDWAVRQAREDVATAQAVRRSLDVWVSYVVREKVSEVGNLPVCGIFGKIYELNVP